MSSASKERRSPPEAPMVCSLTVTKRESLPTEPKVAR